LSQRLWAGNRCLREREGAGSGCWRSRVLPGGAGAFEQIVERGAGAGDPGVLLGEQAPSSRSLSEERGLAIQGFWAGNGRLRETQGAGSGRRQRTARLRGPALSACLCALSWLRLWGGFHSGQARPSWGKVVPGQNDHPAQPSGAVLRSKVVSAFAKRRAGFSDDLGAMPRSQRLLALHWGACRASAAP
jgi:hypothetical protein